MSRQQSALLPRRVDRQVFSAILSAFAAIYLFIAVLPAIAEANDEARGQREIVDVFVPEQDGYPAIRIPSLITTNNGTLLAFAEGRQGGDHSENDLIMKRSTDNGSTWSDVVLLNDQGKLSLNNPQAVVLQSGRILLMYQRSKLGEHKASDGYGPNSYFTFVQTSDDDGQTWAAPRDVSKQVKREKKVTSVAAGPGIGIVLQNGPHKGRIIMPFNQGPYNNWRVYAAYSDDDGQTWNMGDVAPGDGKGHANEVQMVELSDGRVMLNARTQGKGSTKHRKVAVSDNGGQTWSQLQMDQTLIEPTCQASILRYSWPSKGKSRIIFSNPASQTKRENGVLRISYDEGQSWPSETNIYPGGFAYSCLTRMQDRRVGVLFERDNYKTISFVAISLSELESSKSQSGSSENDQENN
ncbi:Exo-alpha-sialidase [Rhodopirellula baltica SH28]|uniref:exo-alpha-sialidase n=1 Tax=Rhodopirellula baltica SH28 TaxID=993517 RepID=K5DN80_RHOBT|nr:sialidase family protein [Rhodopirellula baltica]EKK03943.1 Exo-alpha-sialidase [Rhodopirellula baltica SH28]